MYYPTGMARLYDNSSSVSKSKVPTALTIYYLILAFIYGVNIGVTSIFRGIFGTVANFYSTLISAIVIVILHIPLTTLNSDFAWYVISFLQYICYFVSLRSTNYNVWDLMKDLHQVCGMSRINRSLVGIYTWTYTVIIYGSKGVLIYIGCEIKFPELCNFSYIPYYVYSIQSLAVDFTSVVILMTYGYIYYCVKDLNDLFDKEKSIDMLKRRYVAVANAVDKIRPLYNKLIIFELLFEIPKMMALMYNMIQFFHTKPDLFQSMSEYIYALHVMAHITLSGGIVQLVRSQMDVINANLHQLLLEEEDPKKQTEATRLVAYMKARRLWRPVAGVIPVDMQLPVSALSICATYLIVLIQFTHVV